MIIYNISHVPNLLIANENHNKWVLIKLITNSGYSDTTVCFRYKCCFFYITCNTLWVNDYENKCNSRRFKIPSTKNYSYWYDDPTNIHCWWCRKSASHVYRRFYLFRFIFQPAGLEVCLYFVLFDTEDIPSEKIVSHFWEGAI